MVVVDCREIMSLSSVHVLYLAKDKIKLSAFQMYTFVLSAIGKLH
jgi:hypothetical protein